MAYAVGDAEPRIWIPGDTTFEWAETFTQDVQFVAHNAAFEIAIWNHVMTRYGWPTVTPADFTCTMAMAYAMSLPGSLENASAAVGIDMQKDMKGHRVMLQLCQPKEYDCLGDPIWYTKDAYPEKYQQLYAYCIQDTRVEQQLHKRLVALSAQEQRVWQLDQKINQRGVMVDLAAVDASIDLVKAEQNRLHAAMRKVTGNQVATYTAVTQLATWLESCGVVVDGVAKADVIELLDDPDLPPACREALLIRQEAAKSSTAKLEAMRNGVGEDGRMRGLFQYHGASTGRWAGRRVQLQNLPRPKISAQTVDDVLEMITKGTKAADIEMFYGSILSAVSDCLRGYLIAAPGHDFIAMDFKAIEARVLAWLAGEEWKLQAFRDEDAKTGPEVYLLGATKILTLIGRPPAVPLTKKSPERQGYGKVPELALGYQGGVGAFQTMAKTYGVKVSDTEADAIKTAWREAHPNVVKYWYAVEDAAVRAVANVGAQTSAGPVGREVKFKKSGSFLWCKLPSNRVLCYPYPRIEEIETPWGALKDAVTYMCEVTPGSNQKIIPDKNDYRNWQRIASYGGKFVENIDQAVSRDLLVEAMFRAENHNYPIICHAHDEVVAEVPVDFGSEKELEGIMSIVPSWATGLPVSAEGWRGRRYRK